MAACEQAGDRELYRLVLAYNNFTNLPRERLNVIGHAGMICGNNVFRKHDTGGTSFRFVTLIIIAFPARIWQVEFFCGFSRSFCMIIRFHCARFARFLPRAPARARHGCVGTSFDRGRGSMRVAITFRSQAEHECCSNEDRYASLSRREAESLPHFIEFETTAFVYHEWVCGILVVRCRAVALRGAG